MVDTIKATILWKVYSKMEKPVLSTSSVISCCSTCNRAVNMLLSSSLLAYIIVLCSSVYELVEGYSYPIATIACILTFMCTWLNLNVCKHWPTYAYCYYIITTKLTWWLMVYRIAFLANKAHSIQTTSSWRKYNASFCEIYEWFLQEWVGFGEGCPLSIFEEGKMRNVALGWATLCYR